MDFGWFLTIPGMLITGGVLLLIIALIIFITTSCKKAKKEVKNNNTESTNNNANNGMELPPLTNPPSEEMANLNSVNVSPESSVTSTPESVNVTEQPSVSVAADSNSMNTISPVENMVQQDTPSISAIPSTTEQAVTIDQQDMGPQIAQMEPTVSPIVDNQAPIPKENTPVMETPTMITPGVAPITDNPITPNVTPVIEQQGSGTPDMIPVTNIPPVTPTNSIPADANATISTSPVEGNSSEPNIEPTMINPVAPVSQEPTTPTVVAPEPTPVTPEIIPITDTSVVQQSNPTPIYGGADPSVNNVNDSQTNNHQIYGGANPLENTQVIPVQTQEVTPVPSAVVPSVEAISPQTNTGTSTTSTESS